MREDVSANPPLSPLARLRRRPAVSAAIALIVGVVLHPYLPVLPSLWLAAAAALAIAALWVRRLADPALLLALFCGGAALGQLQHYRYPTDHIGLFLSHKARLAEMELLLTEPPRRTQSTDATGKTRQRQLLPAQVVRLRTRNGWQATSGDISVRLAEPRDDLRVNQTIRVLGSLSRPAPPLNPGQFDWSAWYRRQRVPANLWVSHAIGVQVLTDPGPTALQAARRWVRERLTAGFTEENALDRALLAALLLGDGDPMLREVREQFRRTGTSHHLAISGSHIAVLGGFVFLLLRLGRSNPRPAAVLAMLFVTAYGLMTQPSPPVVRSILLAVAFGLGVISRRSLDGVQLLAVSIVLMLLWDPLDLYSAGFQLSYGTVLGLMLFTRPLLEWMRSLEDIDRRVLRSLVPPRGLNRVLLNLRRALAMTMAASMVAFAVSAPLVAWHFSQINPWAAPAGILLSVPVFLSLVMGLIKIVLSVLLPPLSSAWAALAVAPVALMRYGVEWLGQIPATDLPTPSPHGLMVGGYYLLLAAPLLAAGIARWKRLGQWAPVVSLPMVLFLPPALGDRGELRLTALAVGAGSCCVIERPDGQTWLVDCGGSGDIFTYVLAPYLRSRGITRIDRIYLTHGDLDHTSAAAEVCRRYGTRELWVDDYFTRNGGLPTRKLCEQLRKLQCNLSFIGAGAEDGPLEILGPLTKGSSENDRSLVLRLSHGGQRILFTGDIEQAGMSALLSSGGDLRADVLIAPHHGSAEAVSADFLQAVNPRCIISSSGADLSSKQRQFDALAAHYEHYRTGRDGAVTVRVDRQGSMRVQPFISPKSTPPGNATAR